jgi:hypothetical protein
MRRLLVPLCVILIGVTAVAAQAPKDSEKAAATRDLLKTKISVDYKDALLQDVAKDLTDQVKASSKKEFPTKIDTNSGASINMKINYTGKDKTVAEVLDEMGKKHDLGYIVINVKYKTYTKYDGFLLITKGTERGFPDKPK